MWTFDLPLRLKFVLCTLRQVSVKSWYKRVKNYFGQSCLINKNSVCQCSPSRFPSHRIMYKPGLKTTSSQRSVTGQTCLLTGHFSTSPVISTGHIQYDKDFPKSTIVTMTILLIHLYAIWLLMSWAFKTQNRCQIAMSLNKFSWFVLLFVYAY